MLALRLVSASVTAMLPQLTGEGASALADMGLTPARLGDTAPPAATEVTLERMTSDTSTAAESKKENELYSWLRDKAGLSQAVIEKSKAKLSEEDVDSVEALQALHKLGQLADVFSPVPAQQIADALATDAAEEVKKNPWETGEPGYWDTNGQWVSTDAPAQGGENPAASLQPEEGRCGPMFNGTRCDCSQANWAVFCNSANGWCGDSAEHANADDLTKFDCPLQLRPALPTEGRCGPLFKGKRCDCSTDSSFQWCNSGTGWCGDSTEHANADDLTKYDCLSARDAPGAPEAQGHGKEENRTGDPSLDELEERLRDLEEMRCQTAGKRCKAAAVPVPVPPDSSKRSEGGKTPSIAGGSLVS